MLKHYYKVPIKTTFFTKPKFYAVYSYNRILKLPNTTQVHENYKHILISQPTYFFDSKFKVHFSNHFNILLNIGRYATNMIVKSTASLDSETTYLNYFFSTRLYNAKFPEQPLFFFTTPHQNPLQIKTIIKKPSVVTIQVALRFFIVRQVTVPL